MALYSFMQLLPILLLTLTGFFVSRLYALSIDTLVKIIADIFMPMLIFFALYNSTIQGDTVLRLIGASSFITIVLTLAAYLYSRYAGIDARSFMPAIIFMNSGFLGIPLMNLWGGIEAMNLVVIYDQVQTIFIFTLGIFIITGGLTVRSASMVIRSPILWAVIGGACFRVLTIPLPAVLLSTFEFAGNAAPPLAAFTLGISLHEYRFRIDRHIVAGLALRFIGGILIGLTAASLFSITGLARTVVIVSSALPSAVFSAVLPLRYGVRADFAGTLVVLSTVLGILTIPISFWLAG